MMLHGTQIMEVVFFLNSFKVKQRMAMMMKIIIIIMFLLLLLILIIKFESVAFHLSYEFLPLFSISQIFLLFISGSITKYAHTQNK